jgi:hypothetical protein
MTSCHVHPNQPSAPSQAAPPSPPNDAVPTTHATPSTTGRAHGNVATTKSTEHSATSLPRRHATTAVHHGNRSTTSTTSTATTETTDPRTSNGSATHATHARRSSMTAASANRNPTDSDNMTQSHRPEHQKLSTETTIGHRHLVTHSVADTTDLGHRCSQGVISPAATSRGPGPFHAPFQVTHSHKGGRGRNLSRGHRGPLGCVCSKFAGSETRGVVTLSGYDGVLLSVGW